MVRLNTDIEDENARVHLFLEESTKDVLMPKSLCGEISMGHFDLERPREAAEELPVAEEYVDNLADLLTRLTVEGLMCQECVDEYRDEVGGLKGLGRRYYPDKHDVDGTGEDVAEWISGMVKDSRRRE